MTGIPKMAAGVGLWKIGAILALIVTLVVGAFAIKTQIESKQLNKQNAALSKSINDPVTGYIARLNTARNNVVVLKSAVAKQNAEYTRQSQASQAELNRLKQELKVAQAKTVVYQRRVSELLGKPIEGNTAQERYDSVDKMILEDLGK